MLQNGFNFIIRSHECVDDGYEMWFDSTLLTIFSASNYCGDTGNLGAFVTYLDGSDMIPRITTFVAVLGAVLCCAGCANILSLSL